MNNKYIVLNPQGLILVKCHSTDKASAFIEQHIKKNKENYRLLIGRVPTSDNFQIIDVDAIPVYNNEAWI